MWPSRPSSCYNSDTPLRTAPHGTPSRRPRRRAQGGTEAGGDLCHLGNIERDIIAHFVVAAGFKLFTYICLVNRRPACQPVLVQNIGLDI